MGAWGEESCSNDSCWDNLYAENIHEMTQAEADNSLVKAFSRQAEDDDDLCAKVGVVIWILRQGLRVKEKYLDRAKDIAYHLLGCKEYLDRWNSSKTRAAHLGREIEEIKEAIKDGGLGKKQHIPGLFEKIAALG
jgi:hypothetical protein